MAEFNPDDFEATLVFFILSGFSAGPRSVLEIQQRLKWAERLLHLAAARNGKRDLRSLSELLERLRDEGCLECEHPFERTGAEMEKIYSLTDAGERWLEQERARRHSMVAQFLEESELDASFQRFLDRNGPLFPG